MGMSIWAFIHMIDRADWETGIVHDWKDAEEAADMGRNSRTVRDWRQNLQENGYITAVQKQHSLDLIIHKWINPRDYSSKVMNTTTGGEASFSQGDTNLSPSESQGDTQGSSQSVTPTYSSDSLNSNSIKDDEQNLFILSRLYETNIGIITPMSADFLRNASLDFPLAWFEPAFKIAVANNVRKWSYVEAILDSWKTKGFGWKPNYKGNGREKQKTLEPTALSTEELEAMRKYAEIEFSK
jgi:DnaD/phage-associated family protein